MTSRARHTDRRGTTLDKLAIALSFNTLNTKDNSVSVITLTPMKSAVVLAS